MLPVAVGMPVAGHPPHRSRRAELPHRARSWPAFDASEREREIAGIERRATRICAALLLRRQLAEGAISDRHEGEVVGVVGGGVFVSFQHAFEGFLPARTIGDEYFAADAMECS